jgi:hypothetical protein
MTHHNYALPSFIHQSAALWLLASSSFVLPQSAAGQNALALSDYDARIRKEASLSDKWFNCKTVDDCVLVGVPCSPSIAVNVGHKIEAQDAINKTARSQRCLGNALDTSLAACEKGQCVTKQRRLP